MESDMPTPARDPKELHSEPLLLRLRPSVFERLAEAADERDTPVAVLGRQCLVKGLELLERELNTEQAA
jgi:coenzyme F420-reducing hydrogenase beta subunit